MQFKVVVTGGRDYTNKEVIYTSLNNIHSQKPITTLIEGAARGVDTICKEWANENNIPVEEYKADWKKNGKSAGFIRNKEMLEKSNPDFGVVFPGGVGTMHMYELIKQKGLDFLVITDDGN